MTTGGTLSGIAESASNNFLPKNLLRAQKNAAHNPTTLAPAAERNACITVKRAAFHKDLNVAAESPQNAGKTAAPSGTKNATSTAQNKTPPIDTKAFWIDRRVKTLRVLEIIAWYKRDAAIFPIPK